MSQRDVRRKVEELFTPKQHSRALRLLRLIKGSRNDKLLLRLAVLDRCGGDLKMLRRLVKAALLDWRDVTLYPIRKPPKRKE